MNKVWNLKWVNTINIHFLLTLQAEAPGRKSPSYRTTSWKSQPSKLPWQEKGGLGAEQSVLQFLLYRPEFSHMAGTEVQGQLRLRASSPCVLKNRKWCGEHMAMSLYHLGLTSSSSAFHLYDHGQFTQFFSLSGLIYEL